VAENLPPRDAEGYLIDPQDWTEEFARAVAKQEGISLADEHWQVIAFMRQMYVEKLVAPDVRHVIKHLSSSAGAGRNRIFELFPYGYAKQACKMAGMKQPRAWSTG